VPDGKGVCNGQPLLYAFLEAALDDQSPSNLAGDEHFTHI
jgi:hypothetical protein